MTAGRLYCIQSWNNASAYSGEQIGTRLAASKGLHFDRLGNANTALYSEDESKPAVKEPIKKKSVTDSILLADRHLNRLEDMSSKLEEEYLSGVIDTEMYAYARKTLDVRLEKAWRRVEKEKFSLFPSLTEEECSSTLNTSKQNVVLHRVFDGVSHDNCIMATMVAVHSFLIKLKRIYGVIKS